MKARCLIDCLLERKKWFGIIIFILIISESFSQSSTDTTKLWKYSVCIQLNPAVDEFNDIYYPVDSRKMFAYAFRFGYKIHPNINIGPEFSGYKREHFSSVRTNMFAVAKIGVFGRVSINRLKYVLPFFEASGYFYHCKTIINLDYYEENSFNALRGYIAPGISVSLFKDRFNIDLMYKIGDEFVNRKKSMISYRIGYNFNLR